MRNLSSKDVFVICLSMAVMISIVSCNNSSSSSGMDRKKEERYNLVNYEEYKVNPIINDVEIKNPRLGYQYNTMIDTLTTMDYYSISKANDALLNKLSKYNKSTYKFTPNVLSQEKILEVNIYTNRNSAWVEFLRDGESTFFEADLEDIKALSEDINRKLEEVEQLFNPEQSILSDEVNIKLLGKGFSEKFLSEKINNHNYKSSGSTLNAALFLSMDEEDVKNTMINYQKELNFVNRLMTIDKKMLSGLAQDGYYSKDGKKTIFEIYNPDEYLSYTYLLWVNGETGERKLLSKQYFTQIMHNKVDDTLAVSNSNNLWFYDINIGDEKHTLDFKFGTYYGYDPEYTIVGMKFDGFKNNYLIAYTENPVGRNIKQNVYLAVYNRKGEIIRNINTTAVKPSLVKFFPSVVDIYIRNDGLVDMAYFDGNIIMDYMSDVFIDIEV